MNRCEAVRALLVVAAAVEPLGTFAQSRPGKVARVGVLDVISRASSPSYEERLHYDAFEKLGWIEGKNIVFDYRFADGQPSELPRLAAELVQLNPDVLLVPQNLEAEAALRATRTIPIVVMAALDPVGAGLAQSIAHPGASVTGLLWSDARLAAKSVQLLLEMVPTVRRLGQFYDPNSLGVETYIEAAKGAAGAAHLEVRSYAIRDSKDLAAALSMIEKERVDAIRVGASGVVSMGISTILTFAAKHRLPTICLIPRQVERGGLLSYSPSLTDIADRLAAIVDKILRGVKPGDIPFEYPTRLELTINLKTANALGIKVPQSILVRADRLIE